MALSDFIDPLTSAPMFNVSNKIKSYNKLSGSNNDKKETAAPKPSCIHMKFICLVYG